MATRRPDDYYQERVILAFDHAQITATLAQKLWKVPAGRTFQLDRVAYVNPTGLAENASNYYVGTLKNGSTVVATLFNTDSTGGASLAADTWTEGTLNTTPSDLGVAAGGSLDLDLTLTGTATLPAGHLVVEGRLF